MENGVEEAVDEIVDAEAGASAEELETSTSETEGIVEVDFVDALEAIEMGTFAAGARDSESEFVGRTKTKNSNLD